MADACLAERPMRAPAAACAAYAPNQEAPAVLDTPTQPPAYAHRAARLLALRERLQETAHVLDAAAHAATRRHLFEQAWVCDDWPLVAHVGHAMHALGEADVDDLGNLALALWRMGECEPAADLLRRVLLLAPHHRDAAQLCGALEAWRRSRAGAEPDIDDGELRLQMLGHHHIDDFRWQYDEIREAGDQALYGVWHRYWGFVGSVSLILSGDIGLFYYWIGRDFRGLGLGPRAGRLLLHFAQTHWGVRASYAKVYAHNHASLRGLAKIGFCATAVPIMRPNAAPEQLMRWPSAEGGSSEEAWSFLRCVDAETRVLSADPRHEADASPRVVSD